MFSGNSRGEEGLFLASLEDGSDIWKSHFSSFEPCFKASAFQMGLNGVLGEKRKACSWVNRALDGKSSNGTRGSSRDKVLHIDNQKIHLPFSSALTKI